MHRLLKKLELLTVGIPVAGLLLGYKIGKGNIWGG
jgi:hypothetical protein